MATWQAPWFPIVFVDKCDGCAKHGKPRCVDYCQNGVFTFENGKAVVAYPTKCVSGCTACAPLCHNKAISFPQRPSVTSSMAENKKLLRRAPCPVCGKIYWTNRESDICFDCERQ
ncbi:MAG: ATP-binding protein [Candidatus Bathyarchaeales archaeon]